MKLLVGFGLGVAATVAALIAVLGLASELSDAVETTTVVTVQADGCCGACEMNCCGNIENPDSR